MGKEGIAAARRFQRERVPPIQPLRQVLIHDELGLHLGFLALFHILQVILHYAAFH